MMRAALAALTLLALTTVAQADIPPPPGYVEQCTVAKQQKAGEECVSCGAAYFREPDACKKMYADQGYTRRCRTRGASTWDEVWCREKGAAPAPKPAPTPAPTPDEVAPTPAPTPDEVPPTPPAPEPAADVTAAEPADTAPPAKEEAPPKDEPAPTPSEPEEKATPTPPPASTTPAKKSACAGGPTATPAWLLLALLALLTRRRARRA